LNDKQHRRRIRSTLPEDYSTNSSTNTTIYRNEEIGTQAHRGGDEAG